MKLYRNIILYTLLIIGMSACEKSFEYDLSEIPDDFVGLEEPASGEGFQIHVPVFPIPAGYEREWFMRKDFGNTEEVFVKSFESKCRPGTHHLIAYGFEEEDKDNLPPLGVMRDQNGPDGRINLRGNMSGDLAYFISQNADFRLDLPEGAAVRIPANASMDINSHYFNKTDRTLFGEVYINAYTMPEEEVTEVLEITDVTNEDELILKPKSETTISYTEIFDEEIRVRMMVSHMHKRGVLFDVFMVGGSRDGEKLYSAWDYQHPPTLFFDEPLIIKKGEGLRTEVKYINETNRTIKYGVTSEDEMGILFMMYSK